MKYEMHTPFISKIYLSEDGSSINVDMTIPYGVEGMEKLTPSTTGCTINLSLQEGHRNILVSELDEKTDKWFNENFNNIIQ